MTRCYPVALLLEGRPCLVVGGGRIAERKIASLRQAGASVRVVALEVSESVRRMADTGEIELHQRAFAVSDLDGVFLVIVATDNAYLNEHISAECRRRGQLVNVVDQPALCTFYVPATIERGPVSVSISTSGVGPALARHLRQLLEGVVGEEYGQLALLMGELRDEVKVTFDRQPERAAAWKRLLNSEVLDLLRRGETEAARRHARETMGLGAEPEDGVI
jgi:precorrin-2 dehydrogenase / sirohydrochlorin ferrochelatase